MRFALGASFLLARGGTQRVPANPPPAAGFDNPTGAIFAPKVKDTPTALKLRELVIIPAFTGWRNPAA